MKEYDVVLPPVEYDKEKIDKIFNEIKSFLKENFITIDTLKEKRKPIGDKEKAVENFKKLYFGEEAECQRKKNM